MIEFGSHESSPDCLSLRRDGKSIGYLVMRGEGPPRVVLYAEDAIAELTLAEMREIMDRNEKQMWKTDQRVTVVAPPYYYDDQPCDYCQRPIGSPHKSWCRQ